MISIISIFPSHFPCKRPSYSPCCNWQWYISYLYSFLSLFLSTLIVDESFKRTMFSAGTFHCICVQNGDAVQNYKTLGLMLTHSFLGGRKDDFSLQCMMHENMADPGLNSSTHLVTWSSFYTCLFDVRIHLTYLVSNCIVIVLEEQGKWP